MILSGRHSEVADMGDRTDFWALSEGAFNCRLSEASKEVSVLELMSHTKASTVWALPEVAIISTKESKQASRLME